MPVVIGGKPESNFSDPMGLLADCHRRIERFIGVLSRVAAEASAKALGDEERKALETGLNYFRDAAPKHTADEEETLFPRMRRSGKSELEAALVKVEGLEKDHAEAEALHAEVDRIGREWLADGALTPEKAIRFSALTARLGDLYRAHISVEENDVFPAAASALSRDERNEIGKEMAARRGVRAGF